LGSQALTIPSRGTRRSRAFPVASPVSVIPAPYSLAHFHRFSSLLHSFTSSPLFFTSSLIHFFTAFFTSSTVFRDPNHGERKFPHFRGATSSFHGTNPFFYLCNCVVSPVFRDYGFTSTGVTSVFPRRNSKCSVHSLGAGWPLLWAGLKRHLCAA